MAYSYGETSQLLGNTAIPYFKSTSTLSDTNVNKNTLHTYNNYM